MIINKIVISDTAPNTKEVGWLLPLEDGTFKLRFYGLNGWVDAASGVQGPKGEKGDTGPQGPAGADGKSIKAIAFTTTDGVVAGGTATLSDDSTIQITVTQS